jgi:hypothetical protein
MRDRHVKRGARSRAAPLLSGGSSEPDYLSRAVGVLRVVKLRIGTRQRKKLPDLLGPVGTEPDVLHPMSFSRSRTQAVVASSLASRSDETFVHAGVSIY